MTFKGAKVIAKALSGVIVLGGVFATTYNLAQLNNMQANKTVIITTEREDGFTLGGERYLNEDKKIQTTDTHKMTDSAEVKMRSEVSEDICDRVCQTNIYGASLKYAEQLKGMTIVLTDGERGSIRQEGDELYIDATIALDVFSGIVID